MSEVMMGFYEAVIEWHDVEDTDGPGEVETSPTMTQEACAKWLAERVDLSTHGSPFEGQAMAPIDEGHRITDGRDGERWCYYWLRPSSQMALL